MPRSRPASNPVSYHRHTRQYYVTRVGKRIYLGAEKEQAIRRYHELGLGSELRGSEPTPAIDLTVKELANRFLTAQRANWRNPETTLKSYKDWLGRFLLDHPGLRVADFTVEAFATWNHIAGDRIALPRSKTGISQTYCLWPETLALLDVIRLHRDRRRAKAGESLSETAQSENVFITRFGRPWNKDAIAEQFRRLCKKAGVKCKW